MTPQSRLQQQIDGRSWLRCPAPVTYVKLGEGNGIILNIGEGGLAVKTLASVAQEELLQISFLFAKSQTWIETKGRIAWRNESRKVTGVEFVDLPDQAREQVRQWISSATPLGEVTSLAKQADDRRTESEISHESGLSNIGGARDEGSTSWEPASTREIPFPVRNAATPGFQDLVAVRPSQNSTGAEQVAEKIDEYSQAPKRQDQKIAGFRNLILPGTCLVLVCVLVAGFFESRSRRSVPGVAAQSDASAQSRLGLRIESAGRDWRLSWNPDAPLIESAAKGHLSITDGTLHKVLDLDPSDLRSGTVMYTPLTSEVALRLEVENAVSQATTSESIRITSGAPAGLPTQAPSQSRKDSVRNTSQVASASRAKNESRAPSTALTSTAVAGSAPPAPIRADHSKTSNSSGPTEIKPVTPSQTSEAEIPAARTQPSSELGATSVSNPTPPQPAAVAPPVEQDVVPHVSRLEPAQLIKRKNPVYPAAERAAHIAGDVLVRFHIGADGGVRDVTVVSGNAALAKAAVEAVQEWRYKPALLNGTGTETEGSAVLEFQP